VGGERLTLSLSMALLNWPSDLSVSSLSLPRLTFLPLSSISSYVVGKAEVIYVWTGAELLTSRGFNEPSMKVLLSPSNSLELACAARTSFEGTDLDSDIEE
jgi:hypothetical protein